MEVVFCVMRRENILVNIYKEKEVAEEVAKSMTAKHGEEYIVETRQVY